MATWEDYLKQTQQNASSQQDQVRNYYANYQQPPADFVPNRPMSSVPAGVGAPLSGGLVASPNRAGDAARYAQQEAQRRYWAERSGNLAGADPGAVRTGETYDGLTGADLLTAIIQGVVGGDVGGGGGGGGSYGSGAMADAMRQYALQLQAAQNPYTQYQQMMAPIYDPAAVESRWNRAQESVRSAGQSGLSRLDEIVAALDPRVQQAGESIQGAVSARQAALQQLAGEMGQAQGADVSNLNQILASADAGNVAAESVPLQNLLTAAGSTLGDISSLYGQAMADRAALTGQLRSDVATGMTRDETALMNQIAQARAADVGSLDRARREFEANMFMQGRQWEDQQAQARYQLMLQLAQLGIDPASIGMG